MASRITQTRIYAPLSTALRAGRGSVNIHIDSAGRLTWVNDHDTVMTTSTEDEVKFGASSESDKSSHDSTAAEAELMPALSQAAGLFETPAIGSNSCLARPSSNRARPAPPALTLTSPTSPKSVLMGSTAESMLQAARHQSEIQSPKSDVGVPKFECKPIKIEQGQSLLEVPSCSPDYSRKHGVVEVLLSNKPVNPLRSLSNPSNLQVYRCLQPHRASSGMNLPSPRTPDTPGSVRGRPPGYESFPPFYSNSSRCSVVSLVSLGARSSNAREQEDTTKQWFSYLPAEDNPEHVAQASTQAEVPKATSKIGRYLQLVKRCLKKKYWGVIDWGRRS